MMKLKDVFRVGRAIMRSRYHWRLDKKLAKTRNWRVVPTILSDGRLSCTAWAVRCQIRGWFRWHQWEGPACATVDEAIAQLKHMWLPVIQIDANGNKLPANIIQTFTTWVVAEKAPEEMP